VITGWRWTKGAGADYQVTARTVLELRKALDGVPDDFLVVVVIAEELGSDLASPDQLIISAALGTTRVTMTRHSTISIGLEFVDLVASHPEEFRAAVEAEAVLVAL
jgi:hypothetical protein